MTQRPRSLAPGDRGQATVEFALGLPLVCLLALGVVQVAVVALHRVALQSVARTAARAASVAWDPRAAAHGVADGASLQPVRIEVDVRELPGGTAPVEVVTVVVFHTDTTDVPLVGLLLPDVRLEASATMPLEPP